jgi:hypothetical protein
VVRCFNDRFRLGYLISTRLMFFMYNTFEHTHSACLWHSGRCLMLTGSLAGSTFRAAGPQVSLRELQSAQQAEPAGRPVLLNK